MYMGVLRLFVCVFVCSCLGMSLCLPILHVSVRVSLPPFLWKSNTAAAATSLHIPPVFDSIQSTVCIITLVPYGNLLGPKYCSLTNHSFVFSRYTKHQSCFRTHTTQQSAYGQTPLLSLHTQTPTPSPKPRHHPPVLPRITEQCGTQSWLIRTARHAMSLIFLSSRWRLLQCKEITSLGLQEGWALFWRNGQKQK